MISILLMFLVLAAGMAIVRYMFPHKYTWPEFFGSMAVLLVVLSVSYELSLMSKASDTQILSGKVVGKTREVVPCEHSYPCHCHEVCEGSGRNESCSQECDTCYEHPFDVDWDVQTTVGTLSIDREDSQGLVKPQRWSAVQIGEPASVASTYQNYIKAVPGSLYNRTSNEPTPEYPATIYDYYHIDRVVDYDLHAPKADLASLNEEISDELRDVAGQKQVNLVIVLVDASKHGQMFVQDLKAAWLGGKKNDLVIVIASSQYPKIEWDDVFSWSKDDLVNVTVRDSIRDYGKIDNHVVELAVDGIVHHWTRKRMHEYEYLKREIEPSVTAYVIIFLIGGLVSFGSAFFFIKNADNFNRYN